MGMGGPMMCLRGTINTLQKTWQAWWDEQDPKRRKKLRDNFEHLLQEAQTFLGYIDEEWRSAFLKPKRRPKYDEKLQHSIVDNYVPEYDRKKKA